jgi:hypothetical protein
MILVELDHGSTRISLQDDAFRLLVGPLNYNGIPVHFGQCRGKVPCRHTIEDDRLAAIHPKGGTLGCNVNDDAFLLKVLLTQLGR